MNQKLQERCQLFVENKNTLDKGFVWDGAMIMPVCAMLHAEQNRKVDVSKMKECRKILKEKVGVFSGLRSYGELVLLSKMAMSENPADYLEKTIQAYTLIKKHKMSESAFTALAAMLLVEHVDLLQWEQILESAQRIYARMKKEHPFLTGAEDVSFAILMAMSDLPEEWMMQEAEACYEVLRKKLGVSDGVQSLSHILSMDERETTEKCDGIFELGQMFKEKKKRFNSEGIVLYGGLNMLQVDRTALLDEIVEVDEYLKVQKGFGFFGIDAYQRLMYASMLVINQYEGDNRNMQMSMLNSTIAAIIAEYTALFATMTVVTAASVTSNS